MPLGTVFKDRNLFRAKIGIHTFYRARGGRDFHFASSDRMRMEVVMADATKLQLGLGSETVVYLI
jgi:hypothetical protein